MRIASFGRPNHGGVLETRKKNHRWDDVLLILLNVSRADDVQPVCVLERPSAPGAIATPRRCRSCALDRPRDVAPGPDIGKLRDSASSSTAPRDWDTHRRVLAQPRSAHLVQGSLRSLATGCASNEARNRREETVGGLGPSGRPRARWGPKVGPPRSRAGALVRTGRGWASDGRSPAGRRGRAAPGSPPGRSLGSGRGRHRGCGRGRAAGRR